jgi:hypothetical protein
MLVRATMVPQSDPWLTIVLICVLFKGHSYLYCNNIKTRSRAIDIARLCPDWCMTDMPIIPASDITRQATKLGEGGAGAVWKATWGLQEVCL